MERTLLRIKRGRGKSAETYGYDVVSGFKTVGFRSNAPASPTDETRQKPNLIAFDLR